MIATWKISNVHVAIFYFPRGGETFPPKFHLILPKFSPFLPKFHFTPTWKTFHISVGIYDYPREDRGTIHPYLPTKGYTSHFDPMDALSLDTSRTSLQGDVTILTWKF